MGKEKLAPIEHYPFQADENQGVLHYAVSEQIRSLVLQLSLSEQDSHQLNKYLKLHFLMAESTFAFEEMAQADGEDFANLYYHGEEHALYQTTYDAIYTVRSLLGRRDVCSKNLTMEGAAAIVIAACNHDTGYVSTTEIPCNYAAKTLVHISQGIENAKTALEKIKVPSFIDLTRVKSLTEIGIYSTNFPFLKEHKEGVRAKMENMSVPQRREAQIVRLTVQLADLGGQTARVDYTSKLVYRLRREMNSADPGSGDVIIGKDEEIAQKSAGFIDFVVKPTVGKSANALLGSKDHGFARAWEEQKHPLSMALIR